MEELHPQVVLERAELPTDRGLGEPELAAGSGHPTLADHGPEVEEVVVVERGQRGLRSRKQPIGITDGWRPNFLFADGVSGAVESFLRLESP
jgi:hypothetical protein